MMAKSKAASAVVLGLGALLAVAAATTRPGAAQDASGGKSGDQSRTWQAVAPGVVEPRSGDIKIAAPVIGRISEVAVKLHEKVIAGEPLLRLDDEAARARVASARAEAAMHERARNDKAAGKAENRRDAEDAVAEAEAALVDALAAFDKAALTRRASGGSNAAVVSARAAWSNAQDNLERQRAQLRRVKAQSATPLPTQVEGQLNIARSALRQAIAELETLTIRAPIAGTVLQVNAKAGELAAPTAPQPLILLGDLSKLRVRAELDERDIGKIKPGDSVEVRADAFHGRTFAGKVIAIAPLIQPGRLNSSGARNLTDFSVTEVLIDLTDPGPLLPGMNVDVYFVPDAAGQKRGSAESGQPAIRAPF